MAKKGLTPAELEYFAEETLVTIIPNVSHPQFRFVSGNFGPLESGLPCEVPLWLAVTLRKRSKCIIRMPDWLQVENLERIVEHERSQSSLGDLPFHYLEIAHILFKHAKDDIINPEKVATLLQDLEQIRMDRLRIGIAQIAMNVHEDQSMVAVTLNNVASMEILSIKEFFLGSLDAFLWLRPAEENNE
jgi:GINS complex subunit 2